MLLVLCSGCVDSIFAFLLSLFFFSGEPEQRTMGRTTAEYGWEQLSTYVLWMVDVRFSLAFLFGLVCLPYCMSRMDVLSSPADHVVSKRTAECCAGLVIYTYEQEHELEMAPS